MIAAAKTRTTRTAGMTSIELVIFLTVLVVVLGGVSYVLVNAMQIAREQTVSYNIRDSARRAMNRINEIVPRASVASVDPLVIDQSPILVFRLVTGHDGTDFLEGDLVRIEHVPATGETLNGLDDNGDGRADEGVIVYQQGTQPEIIVADDITGVSFTSTASGVSFAIEVSLMNKGRLVSRTFTQEISFRNI